MGDQITLTVRPASIRDTLHLAALARRTFRDAFSHLIPADSMDEYLNEVFALPRLTAELEDPQTLFLLAQAGDDTVGYAKLYWGSTDARITGPHPIKLWRLYSLTDYLGRGVGSTLMLKCMDIARERGYRTLWLTVNIGNARAIGFYKRFGFVITGKSGFLLGGILQRDHIMELQLAPSEY